jgi:hypothetical protein
MEYCGSFEELKTVGKIDKNEVFELFEQRLNLKTVISDRNRNRDDLMSHLVSVIEEFLVLEELKTNTDERNLLLSQVLIKRNRPTLFNRVKDRLLKSLAKKSLKNITVSFLEWRILHLTYFSSIAPKINKSVQAQLQELINQFNEFWLLTNYKYMIEIKNRRLVFNEEYQYLDVKQLEPYFAYNFTSGNHSLLEGYELINNLFEKENKDFDEIIEWHGKALEKTKGSKTVKRTASEREELFGIHVLIFNFHSIKFLKGEEKATNQLFKIFRNAIDKGMLDGAPNISHHYYLTVIKLALGLGERKWAIEFIEKYAPLISSAYKQEVEQYVRCLVMYEQNDVDNYYSIRSEIQQVTSSDRYFDIRYRILDIQILYELSVKDIDYENVLKSNLGNFNDMLSSQEFIKDKSITVQGNRNFIKIVKKLILAKYRKNITSASIQKLMNSSQMEYITERLWLQRQLKRLK